MDPFLGEVRMFGGNFAPVGWVLCDGRLLQISEYDALYTLLGTTYGGDGVTTFGVPDLRGRVPVHQGQRPGQSAYTIGQPGGVETVTLTVNQLPNHTHVPLCNVAAGDVKDPSHNFLAANPDYTPYTDQGATIAMNAGMITPSPGGGAPHDNMSPFQVLNFIMATEGIYPSQG